MTLTHWDQCHRWHWNTKIGVTDDTETLRPVSPLSLTHWDQCHRWRWNTEIGVTDDILTTHWNIPRWLGMYPCLYALKHWHWHTEIQCFSVVGDTDLSVSVSSVTPISVFQCRRWRWSQCFSVTDDTDLSVPVSLMTLISVFQCHQWHWCRFPQWSVYRHWYIPNMHQVFFDFFLRILSLQENISL
jgi:hypothetical protein